MRISPLPLLSSGLLQEAIIQKGSGAKEQEGVFFFFFFFISLEMRKESTGKSNFHNFPLKQALKSRLTPPSSCRKLDISTQVMKGTSPRTFAERNERTEIEG